MCPGREHYCVPWVFQRCARGVPGPPPRCSRGVPAVCPECAPCRVRFHPVMVAVLVAAKVPKGRQCSSQQDCAGTASTTCTLDKASGKKYCLCRDGLPPVNSKCAVIPTGRLSMSCQSRRESGT